MRIFTVLFALLYPIFLQANLGVIEGIIYEEDEKTPISFASVAIEGTNKGATTDLDGQFRIEGLAEHDYTLLISFVGYEETKHQVTPSISHLEKVKIILKSIAEELPEIVVKSNTKNEMVNTAAIHVLSAEAIQQSAGSANDVMQTIQSLPGIAAPVGLSNELMIRGGASVENSYFLEGIELPIINHFSSQGTSNGIRSILNNTLLREAKVHTSAFPIATGSTLSGVFDFALKNGNTEKLRTNLLLSTSDASITLDGPLSDRTTFAVVFRQSYLKPTLRMLDRPLLASYNDWQYKLHWNLGNNSTLSLIGVGNTDKRTTNYQASKTPFNQYLLTSIRDGKQWHLTNALKYQYFRDQGHTAITFSFSDVFFNLSKEQKEDGFNDDSPIIDYNSRESNKQLSIRNTEELGDFKWVVGGQIISNEFNGDSFLKWKTIEQNYETAITYKEVIAYSEISQQMNRFNWSVGLKVEGNNFSDKMKNPLNQLSPRVSVGYQLNKQISANVHTGIYYQLPANISLAYRANNEGLTNQAKVDYFSAKHLTMGIKWNSSKGNTLISVEGFYKGYDKYPFSVKDKVALANKGDGFTRVGEEELTSTGRGRSYGVELNIQQHLFKGFHGHINYTLAKSEFMDEQHLFYTASSMDARHILNMTIGKQLKNDWRIGFKGRMQSGMPYTPFDIDDYANIATWSAISTGTKDYSLLNTVRVSNSFGLDLRVDKVFTFRNSTLKVYTDLIDLVRSKVNGAPFITVAKDNDGIPQVNEQHPSQYEIIELDNVLGSFMPTLGVECSF